MKIQQTLIVRNARCARSGGGMAAIVQEQSTAAAPAGACNGSSFTGGRLRGRCRFHVQGFSAVPRFRALCGAQAGWEEATDPALPLHFAWSNSSHSGRVWTKAHSEALVCNRLSGLEVLEDKAKLVSVLRKTRPELVGVLEAHVLRGQRAFRSWCAPGSDGSTPFTRREWWIIKDSTANGGQSLWVATADTAARVAAQLREDRVYVAQEYITRPSLYKGRKFHLRCFGLIKADMFALVYKDAFLLAANEPFTLDLPGRSLDDDDDDEVGVGGGWGSQRWCETHLSNLCMNMHSSKCEGQVRVSLPTAYQEAWPKICRLWAEMARAAGPCARRQVSAHHFEFYGFDVMLDAEGGAWLLEVNRMRALLLQWCAALIQRLTATLANPLKSELHHDS